MEKSKDDRIIMPREMLDAGVECFLDSENLTSETAVWLIIKATLGTLVVLDQSILAQSDSKS
jgi:hypothetical protein